MQQPYQDPDYSGQFATNSPSPVRTLPGIANDRISVQSKDSRDRIPARVAYPCDTQLQSPPALAPLAQVCLAVRKTRTRMTAMTATAPARLKSTKRWRRIPRRSKTIGDREAAGTISRGGKRTPRSSWSSSGAGRKTMLCCAEVSRLLGNPSSLIRSSLEEKRGERR